ncbi:cytochrome P450 [Yoonia sp. 208BN28-4]|uniref:cytochrome P450 n=1 Tax=Yoonia sp. 208BN28-4 TaxID=3126505 RepID=UPI0030A0BD6F
MAYDLTSQKFLRDPRPTITAMQADAPVVQVKLPLIGKLWMTTTDAGARMVLKDTARFVRDSGPITGKSMKQRFWYLPRFLSPIFENLVNADGARHKRLRGLVDQAFARTSITDLRPEMAALADTLIDAMPHDRPVDIASSFARPLPTQAICSLLGVPASDRAHVNRITSSFSEVTGTFGMIKAVPGLWRTMRYFRSEFTRVRAAPGDGLITQLVQANDAGDSFNDDELLAMAVALFLAGSETTAHLITTCVHTALTMPEACRIITDQPEALPLLIEEVMRFYAPVFMTQPLFVAADTELDGVALRKGDQIAPLLIAANHDPIRFDDAGTLIPNRRPNAHLGFGTGPHVCLGMQLARAEVEVALTQLFARYPDMKQASPDVKPVYARRIGVHGLARLDVVLAP